MVANAKNTSKNLILVSVCVMGEKNFLLLWRIVSNFLNVEKMESNSVYIKPGTWQPSTVLTVTFMMQYHVLRWIS